MNAELFHVPAKRKWICSQEIMEFVSYKACADALPEKELIKFPNFLRAICAAQNVLVTRDKRQMCVS